MRLIWLIIWKDSFKKMPTSRTTINIIINDLCNSGGRWNKNIYVLDDII